MWAFLLYLNKHLVNMMIMKNSITKFDGEVPEDALLWRYMDFTKFVDLILSQNLYMRRIDSYEDPYEGYYSDYHKDISFRLYKKVFEKKLGNNFTLNFVDDFVEGNIAKNQRESKLYSYASCWHLNDVESAAMWKLYAQTNEAIAIQTTVGKLYNSFQGAEYPDELGHLYLSKVNYINFNDPDDYNAETLRNTFSHLFLKRKSFLHEQEYRVLYVSYEGHENVNGIMQIKKGWCEERRNSNNEAHKSRYLKINTNELIQSVQVSPTAPKWFFEMTKKFLNKIGLSNIKCEQSTLYDLK